MFRDSVVRIGKKNPVTIDNNRDQSMNQSLIIDYYLLSINMGFQLSDWTGMNRFYFSWEVTH